MKHPQDQLCGVRSGGQWPNFFVVPTVDDGLKQKMAMSKGTRLYLLKAESSWDWIHRIEAKKFIVRSICHSSISKSFIIFEIQSQGLYKTGTYSTNSVYFIPCSLFEALISACFLVNMSFLGDDRHHPFHLLHILRLTVILLNSPPHFQQGNTLMKEGKRQELITH